MLNRAHLFGLIPEVRFLAVESRFGPGEEKGMLMGMISWKIASNLLTARAKDRMNVATTPVHRSYAFRNGLLGLHVFQYGLVAQRDADYVLGLLQLQIRP